MSVIKFNLTEDHIKLVKQLTFSIIDNHLTTLDVEGDKATAFGYDSIHEEIGLILFGKPENFDPFSLDPIEYSEEHIEYMDGLWNDMPTVLELRCVFGDLEPGMYKRKYHDRNWKFIG
jgi:hypothetical protein